MSDTISLIRWLKRTAALVGALTVLISAGVAADSRYVKAADLQKLERRFDIVELRQEKTALDNRLLSLRKSRFELEVAKQDRKLSLIEAQQLSQVMQDIADTEIRYNEIMHTLDKLQQATNR